jgi:propionyl-CoA synthetase
MKEIADNDPWTTPATIDDLIVLDEIGRAIKSHGGTM